MKENPTRVQVLGYAGMVSGAATVGMLTAKATDALLPANTPEVVKTWTPRAINVSAGLALAKKFPPIAIGLITQALLATARDVFDMMMGGMPAAPVGGRRVFFQSDTSNSDDFGPVGGAGASSSSTSPRTSQATFEDQWGPIG